MKKNSKFLIFNLLLNTFIFVFIFLCIQNSSQKRKANFYFTKTIPLPVSFIITSSFITGSLSFSLLKLSFYLE